MTILWNSASGLALIGLILNCPTAQCRCYRYPKGIYCDSDDEAVAEVAWVTLWGFWTMIFLLLCACSGGGYYYQRRYLGSEVYQQGEVYEPFIVTKQPYSAYVPPKPSKGPSGAEKFKTEESIMEDGRNVPENQQRRACSA